MITRREILLAAGGAASTAALFRPRLALAASADMSLPTDIAVGDFVSVTRAPTQQNFVALTFDDGPRPNTTPKLLDILKAHGVRATFFVIGRSAATWPDILKRIADEGHEIGNHSWSHPNFAGRSKATVLREIDRTNEAVFNAVGRLPVTLRPPYGRITRAQERMIHEERGMTIVQWSLDPKDWASPGAEVVARRIVSRSRPGEIVLSHDTHAGTVRAMPAALDGLAERGFHLTTLSLILGQSDWSHPRRGRPPVHLAAQR